jgi:hypothetical protein
VTYTASDVIFERIAHEYRLPDGRLVPSVTQILQAVGVSVDFEGLASLGRRVADAIDLKREIGTALHADAHAFDDDDLDWNTVDPRVQPYLSAWADFRENTGATPATRERRIYHPVYGYAGTLDGIFTLPNGKLVLVDIKTGDPDDSGCAFQTAAYLAAYQHEHALTGGLIERWGVQLTPDHAIPYRIHPYTDWTDFAKFQAFVTTFHHQAARRRRAA